MAQPDPHTPRSRRIGHNAGSFMTKFPVWLPRETTWAKGGRSMTGFTDDGPRTAAGKTKGCKNAAFSPHRPE